MSLEVISNWNFIRLSGFLAYYWFTFAISIGLMSRFGIFQKKKGFMIELHQTSGWAGLLTVIFHLTLLWRDNYINYQIGELFLPFSSDHAPVLSAIGTISFYLFFLVIATSDLFMKSLGRTLWGKIHLLVIPAWILIVVHGIFIGTDSTQPWAAFLYGGGVCLVLALLFLRNIEKRLKSVKTKKGSAPINY